MSMIKKIFPHKVMFVCTAITLIACGGASTKSDTPSIADLQTLADNITAQSLVVAPVSNPLNPADPTDIASTNDIASASATAAALAEGAPEGTFIDAGLPGIADIFIGTVDVPYYFDTANSTTSFWLPTLDVRETLTVPLMMTMPNANSGQVMPDSGWPIAIYQHGITRNRTDVIAYADSLASVGFAVIAIDLPTHGLVDATNPFHADNTPFTEIEQTYGQNETSGENFINLASLLTSRDNLRQGSANLLTLRQSLGGIVNTLDGSVVPIDTDRVGLIAHSLGGMVAIPYLAVESTSTPSSIVMSGATISQVLQESASFGPVIEEGLVALDVTTPQGIAAFYANAQELVDAGEPANYAATAAANHPIHLIEVIGDQTVPNSSTENLAEIMGAEGISIPTQGIAPGNTGIVRFTEGGHASPLDPTESAAATTEIQTQLAIFQFSGGTTIQITDDNVIQ